MRTIFYFFLLCAITLSCTKSDSNSNPNNPLAGTWKLTAILSDPGDGSGTFNPVQSNRVLNFKSNGIVTSNGSLCSMNIETGPWHTAKWALSTAVITVEDCYNDPLIIHFTLSGDTLELQYPCIEACAMKFARQE